MIFKILQITLSINYFYINIELIVYNILILFK